MSLDAVTVGNVTSDVFLLSKAFSSTDGGESVQLPYNAKVDVPDIVYDTGGFAGNCAVTLARVGLKVGCISKVGLDPAGREIVRALDKNGVKHDQMQKNAKNHSAFTAIIKPYSGDRTQLIHRGANFEYDEADFALDKITAKWFMIGSLAGNFRLYRRLIARARQIGAKVAINPGPPELKKTHRLLRLLTKADLAFLNHTEASSLTHVIDSADCLRALRSAGLKNIVISDGKSGAWVLDGGFIFQSGIYKKVRIVDRTGAGDAYNAGFLAARIKGMTVNQAMSFAGANATSVMCYIGAKDGILNDLAVAPMKIKQTYL